MIAMLLLVSTASFAVLSLINQRRGTMDVFVRTCFHTCKSLERVLRFSMLENRRSEIELAMKQIIMEYGIESASLVTHTGKPVYSSSPELGPAVPLEDARCSGCHGSLAPEPLNRMPAESHFRLVND